MSHLVDSLQFLYFPDCHPFWECFDDYLCMRLEMRIKAYVLRIDPKKWNERVLRLLMLFHIAHRGQLWLSVLLQVYLFVWNKFTPSRFWAIWTFKSIGWAWRFDHIPTNCGLSREKKLSRKNFLSENSWFSLWILFPRGWLFQHRARRHFFSRTQFPNPRKSQTQPATCTGCREAKIPTQNTGNFMHRMDILLCLLSWNQGACWRPDSS